MSQYLQVLRLLLIHTITASNFSVCNLWCKLQHSLCICTCFSVITVNVVTVCVCVCVLLCMCVIACSRMRNGPFWRLYQSRYMWISWSFSTLAVTAMKTWMLLRCECQFVSFPVHKPFYCTGPTRMECNLLAHHLSARKDCVSVSR